MFELCEDLFDRVEVGAIGRQEQEFSADVFDGFTNGVAFMRGQIVHDDDIARSEFAHEEFYDISFEDGAIHRARDYQRRDDAVMAKTSDKGGGLPMSVRRLAQKALAARGPAIPRRHVGCCAHFVEKDKPGGIKTLLIAPPQPARKPRRRRDLAQSQTAFFLNVIPSRLKKYHTVVSCTLRPCDDAKQSAIA